MNIKSVAIIMVSALLATSLSARTYYVDSSRANNKGSGRSWRSAKKTIQAAVNVAKKGDTIIVKPGVYRKFKTKNKKITIKSLKGAKKTSIKGKRRQYFVYIADLAKGNKTKKINGQVRSVWIGTSTVLQGFTIRNGNFGVLGGYIKNCTVKHIGSESERNYVYYPNGCSYTTVYSKPVVGCKMKKCIITSNFTDTGAIIYGSNLTKCEISKNGGSCAGGSKTCSLFGECCISDTTIKDSKIHSNSAEVGLIHASVVNRCKMMNNSMKTTLSVIRNSQIFNSLFYNNTREDYNDGTFKNSTVRNSTVIDNDYSSNTTFINTIFDGAHGCYGCTLKYCQGHFEYDYCDASHVNCDINVRFVNPDNNDYRIGKYSPCRNAGCAQSSKKIGTTDIRGKKRVQGGRIDIGCYEYTE